MQIAILAVAIETEVAGLPSNDRELTGLGDPSGGDFSTSETTIAFAVSINISKLIIFILPNDAKRGYGSARPNESKPDMRGFDRFNQKTQSRHPAS